MQTDPYGDAGPASRFLSESHPWSHYEDIEVGLRFPCGSFTFSEDDIVAFARRYDPRVFHVDPEGARASLAGRLIASAAHTFCASVGLFVRATPGLEIVIGMDLRGIEIPAPVAADQEMRVSGLWLAKRLSRSRPGVGIVTWEAETHAPGGILAMRCGSTILVRCRDAAPADG